VCIVVAVALNWPHAQQPNAVPAQRGLAVSQAPVAVTGNKTSPVTQVAPPVVAAVNPSKPSPPTAADLPANFDPRAEIAKEELQSNLNFLIKLALEDMQSIYPHTLGDDYGLSESELIQAKSFLTVTPTLNPAGDVATYKASSYTMAKIREALVAAEANTWLKHFDNHTMFGELHFVKINGKWYSADRDGSNPGMDDKGNMFIDPGDPFAK
jgi:Rieske Fe-S protein